MGYATNQSDNVNQAKQQLREASSQIDFLAPVKNHPLSSIALALTAGYVVQQALTRNDSSKSLFSGLFSLGLWVAKRLLLK